MVLAAAGVLCSNYTAMSATGLNFFRALRGQRRGVEILASWGTSEFRHHAVSCVAHTSLGCVSTWLGVTVNVVVGQRLK
jgi:hypothetical protein